MTLIYEPTGALSRSIRHSFHTHSTNAYCVFPIIKNFGIISSYIICFPFMWCYKLQILRINSLTSLFFINLFYNVITVQWVHAFALATSIPTATPDTKNWFLGCWNEVVCYLSGDSCFSLSNSVRVGMKRFHSSSRWQFQDSQN